MLARVAACLALASIAVACTETVRDFPQPSTERPTAAATTAPPATASPRTTPLLTPTPPATATPPGPTSTPTATARPTLPAGASLPPMPSQPPLPTGATTVATGTVTFSIAAGETRRFEPADLAKDRGATLPSGTTLAWTVAWRAAEPLSAAWYTQTSRTVLGRGRWGTAEMGGASGFELRNDGAASVFGELSYTIGSR
jgi:hypothetical protein